MKKILSLALTLVLLLALLTPVAGAAGAYEGKTVLLYTGNVRGNVEIYAQLAAVKAEYEARGAQVVLADTGNFLQGSAVANGDRGLSVYQLMDAVGYDVAALGTYDLVYGPATTGYVYHSNFYRYYTQAELQQGTEALTYRQNAPSAAEPQEVTRPAKAPATFIALSNYIPGSVSNDYYAFQHSAVVEAGGQKLGFVAITDSNAAAVLQDGFLSDYDAAAAPALPECDVLICLTNSAGDTPQADITIDGSDGAFLVGAYVIDNATGTVTPEAVTLSAEKADPTVAALAAQAKENAPEILGVSQVVLDGADRNNWSGETNLGDLTADALKWYAENKFEGFAGDVPVVAIQNGGNCDNFLYPSDITTVDLLCALPFSPMGVGILYVTGAELLETLEAATQQQPCPGWAQVAGLEYTVGLYEAYDAGVEYGKFYEANSIRRVTVTSVNGQPFDAAATYALIADNYLINGNDTYYTLKNVKNAENAVYLNNGNGVKTRDIVAQYIDQVLQGVVGETYAQPQGRITVLPEDPYENPYSDVPVGLWYYDAICYVTKNELMNGMGDGKFQPNATVSRAMLVTVLYRLENSPEASGYDNPFTDVPDTWYTDAVCWAAANGIVNGITPTTFAPDSPLTREQLATLLYRYAQYRQQDVGARADLSAFPDRAQVSDYAAGPVSWAVARGILSGSLEGHTVYLQPGGNSNRGQLAAVLMRFLTQPDA